MSQKFSEMDKPGGEGGKSFSRGGLSGTEKTLELRQLTVYKGARAEATCANLTQGRPSPVPGLWVPPVLDTEHLPLMLASPSAVTLGHPYLLNTKMKIECLDLLLSLLLPSSQPLTHTYPWTCFMSV